MGKITSRDQRAAWARKRAEQPSCFDSLDSVFDEHGHLGRHEQKGDQVIESTLSPDAQNERARDRRAFLDQLGR